MSARMERIKYHGKFRKKEYTKLIRTVFQPATMDLVQESMKHVIIRHASFDREQLSMVTTWLSGLKNLDSFILRHVSGLGIRNFALYKEILNAIRPTLEAQLYKPVQFVVSTMRVGKGWAFVDPNPE